MPATQQLEFFEGLEVWVEPEEEPDPVYFTSDKPEFNVHLRNNDSEYVNTGDSEFRWTIESNPGAVTHTGVAEFGPVNYGEEVVVTVGGRTLAYEGHGVLGISVGGASGKASSDRREVSAGTDAGAQPAYSFHVWDESHYDASIERPKRLQLAMIGTSIVLILFAGLQILFAMGFFE